MKFEFDEAKRIATIEKHGLDFLGAELLFGAPHLSVRRTWWAASNDGLPSA